MRSETKEKINNWGRSSRFNLFEGFKNRGIGHLLYGTICCTTREMYKFSYFVRHESEDKPLKALEKIDPP